eukprot:TRINITY_DN6042_c0_g1_i1.p1 TRINITY_DN6042_c0_g1~~TRINITY_DN6042_c0_g1_i1.p1  ORF type:complete len:354 (+),score=66.71 TRINITY_DN6042_c0_g1_i1:18-1079(+)
MFLLRRSALGAKQIRLYSSQPDLKSKKVGIIGLGNVGNAVAKNLQKAGYNIAAVLDTDAARLKEFDCAKPENPRALTEQVDVVFTALPMPPHVKSVFEGDAGLLAGMTEGKIWIDHSTTDYEQTEGMNDLVKEKGGLMLEAPVTGGLEALKKGQMTVFMAGEKNLAEEMRPMLEEIYCNVLYTGKMGTALIPKVLSNMLTCVHNLAMGEVFMIAKRAGVDMRTTFDCIRASSGNSFVFETGGPMLMQGTYDPSFSIALQCKDNRLGYQIATKHKVPMEILGHAMQTYNRALYKYGEEAPCYIAPKMLEEALETDLRCDGFENWTYSIQNVDGSSVIRHHGIDIKRTKNPSEEE